MTKRPSAASIRITYINSSGEPGEIGVREIFCRMDGDALILTAFEDTEGKQIRDLPVASPAARELDGDVDDARRLHELALAELDDGPSSPGPVQIEADHEAPPAQPARQRRLPSGPLRQYDEQAAPAQAAVSREAPSSPGPAPRSAPNSQPGTPPASKAVGASAGETVRELDEREAGALRALIEAKAGQARWASGILTQAAERYPNDRGLQNKHLASLLRASLDPMRAESRTPLASALRGVLGEVQAHKGGMFGRDPLKAEKLVLQGFARQVFAPTPVDDGPPKIVTGAAQRTPAQVLAKLEDPKLARAARVKLLLEVVPELIEGWRPDKESGRSEAGNESSPAVVRRLFAVANEQRQQRKFIDDGAAFRKASERYAGLEGKLPRRSAEDDE